MIASYAGPLVGIGGDSAEGAGLQPVQLAAAAMTSLQKRPAWLRIEQFPQLPHETSRSGGEHQISGSSRSTVRL
jgi:hypothetical protein